MVRAPVCVDGAGVGYLSINRDRVTARAVECEQVWHHRGENSKYAGHNRPQPLFVEDQPVHAEAETTPVATIRAHQNNRVKHTLSPLAPIQSVEVILEVTQVGDGLGLADELAAFCVELGDQIVARRRHRRWVRGHRKWQDGESNRNR